MSPRHRAWRKAHLTVNRIAHRVAPTRGLDPSTHPLWRLNDWLAAHWVRAWIEDRKR